MKKLYYFMMVASCLISVLQACKDKNNVADPTISIENPIESFTSSGNALSKEVNITSNYEWKASVPETDNWCTIEKKGNNKLKINLVPNPLTQTRQTKITVISGYEGNIKKAYITVKQEAGSETVLTLNVEELIFLAKGESKQLNLITNQTVWEGILASPVDWITFVKNENGFLITTTENTKGGERNINMTIKAGVEGNQKKATLKISQFGTKPTIRLAKKEIKTPYSGEKIEIDVLTNQVSWKLAPLVHYEILEKEWCKPSIDNNKLIVSIEENIKLVSRRAFVIVIAGEGPEEIKDTLHITQEADVPATLTVESHVVYPKSAGTHQLKITTNRKKWDFKVIEEAATDWIELSKKEYGLEVELKENSDKDKSIKLNLFAGEGENIIQKNVVITQQSGKTSVYVVPSTITLNDNGDERKVKVTANAEWNFLIPDDAKNWCTITKINTQELSVKATKVESGSRSTSIKIFAGKGENAVATNLIVKQDKIYSVGDYYTVNGIKLGVVFKITDGGKHGAVFSLDDMKTYPSYLKLRPNETETMDTPIYGATSRIDGRTNESVLKQKEPNTWRTRFPVLGWIENKNKKQSNPGWYWPAIDECTEIYLMFAGEKNEEDVTSASKKNRDKINRLIEDAGGDIFQYEDPEDWQARYILSSTEEYYQGFPRCWKIFLGRYWVSINERSSAYDEPDKPSEVGAGVRAVLRF